jgi:NAD(P)-dependent dehydrogenase (short-subunit alcohol dehydrogenase family)
MPATKTRIFIPVLLRPRGIAHAILQGKHDTFATPDEVGPFVAFVASPLAAAVNGAAVRVDGGVVKAMAGRIGRPINYERSCMSSRRRNM